MKTLVPLTADSRYMWLDGEYILHFSVKEVAYEYRSLYGGIVIPI